MATHATFIVAAMDQSLEKLLPGIAGVIVPIESTLAFSD